MKRIIYVGVLFLVFVSCVSLAQAEIQNADRVRGQIVNEAMKGRVSAHHA